MLDRADFVASGSLRRGGDIDRGRSGTPVVANTWRRRDLAASMFPSRPNLRAVSRAKPDAGAMRGRRRSLAWTAGTLQCRRLPTTMPHGRVHHARATAKPALPASDRTSAASLGDRDSSPGSPASVLRCHPFEPLSRALERSGLCLDRTRIQVRCGPRPDERSVARIGGERIPPRAGLPRERLPATGSPR